MKIAKIRYGVGYGKHEAELEFEDDATDSEIEDQVYDYVMERVDYGYDVEPA